MIEFIQSISIDELRFISRLDYGNEEHEHYAALKKVIFEQGGVANYDQSWCPYEVIELGANWLQSGHEREFTICTLLVILNVLSGQDGSTGLEYKFETHSGEYDLLPGDQKALILGAYERADI